MSEKPMRTLGNTLLVHIPKRVENTIWIAGRELYFDGSYAEHFNKLLCGVVVAEPGEMGEQYLLQRRGLTAHNVYCSAIVDEIREGDMVYVDWSVTEPHGEIPGLGAVYQATANQVVARVREGELIPYGSYVLCKEIFPDDVEEVDVLGQRLRLRVSALGLALGSEAIPPLPYQGEVVHVGQPLRGQPQRVQVGDRVVFDKRYCGKADGLPLRMKMEGTEYLCIRQDYIEAVVEKAWVRPEVGTKEFEPWLSSLSDEELEQRYRQASADLGNSIDAEQREYFGDLRHEYATELEWRAEKRRKQRRTSKGK